MVMVMRIGIAVIAIGVALQCGALTRWGAVPRAPQRGWPREALIAFAVSTAVIFLGSALYGIALTVR